MRLSRLTIICLLSIGSLTSAEFLRYDFAPFHIETDVGVSKREQKALAKRAAGIINRNLKHFQKLFGLTLADFEEYARFYGSEKGNFRADIPILIWADSKAFLADVQKRYQTKARGAGFFAITTPRDSEGKVTGPPYREITLHMDGIAEKQAMRTLLHEVGRLFLLTYIKVPPEVPSWLGEGTAQLFAYRLDNGTDPELSVYERLAWLYEMTHGDDDDFVRYPGVRALTEVRNEQALAFSHKDPLRGLAQSTEVWGLVHFMSQDSKARRAFAKTLAALRDSAMQRYIALAQQGMPGPELVSAIRGHLYEVQDSIIERSFGGSFEEIEHDWHAWIAETYEETVKKQPELLFYRAMYHGRIRARFAPDKEWYKRCIERSVALLGELEAAHPDEPLVHVGRALLAAQHGQMDVARELFKKAREGGSKQVVVLIYSAGAMIADGKADQVVEDLETALEEAPGNSIAQGYLGQAMLITGQDYRRAAGLLQAAVDNNADQAQLGALTGYAQLLQGEDQDAFFAFAKAYQDSKRSDWLAAAFIVLIGQRGAIDKDPVEWLQRVTQADPEMGAKVTAIYDSGKQLQPAFGPDGRLGFIGVDLDAATAIVPPAKSKTRRRR